jgi:hypothetical protein
MPNRNTKDSQKLVAGIEATLSGTTPADSGAIDVRGSNDVITYAWTKTVTVAGTGGVSFSLTESDTLDGSYTAVDPKEIVGSLADLTFTNNADDNKYLGSIGYVGQKPFIKFVATGTTNTNAQVRSATILGQLQYSNIVS